MESLYKAEQTHCLNYEAGRKPIIQIIKEPKGFTWNMLTGDNTIVFLKEGSVTYSISGFKNQQLESNKMVLLRTGDNFEGEVVENATVIVIRLRNIKQFCDCCSISMPLYDKKQEFEFKMGGLDIKEHILSFLESIEATIADGVQCTYYFDIKIKELMFLLRLYYTKDDLLQLFYPIISQDITFSDFIIQNYKKTKTVKELADLLHYSLSGFQKRFKKVFGVPAYQWMIEQRLKAIYHEINTSNQTLKEISDQFGFSSPSHFNDFCKLNFGATPGKIRRRIVPVTMRPKMRKNKTIE